MTAAEGQDGRSRIEPREVTLVDLLDLIRGLARFWATGLILGVLVGVLASYLALPVYRASTTVLPVSGQEMGGVLARLSGTFGSLTGLAGASLPGGDLRNEAVALLKSQTFAEQMILEEGMMPELFPKKWDSAAGRWRPMPPDEVPTLWDAWLIFDRKLRKVIEDRDRGLVTVRVEWSDRELAAKWANQIIARVNRQLKDKKLTEINLRLKYLNQELSQATLVELKQAIAKVIEEQVNERMIASTRAEYAFRVLDPARAPDADQPIFPKPALLIVLCGAAGMLLGLLLGAFVLYATNRRRSA